MEEPSQANVSEGQSAVIPDMSSELHPDPSTLVSIAISPSTEDILDLVSDQDPEPQQPTALPTLDQTMDELSLGGDIESTEHVETYAEPPIKSSQGEGAPPSGVNVQSIPSQGGITADASESGANQDISKYFASEAPSSDNGADFFDSIVPQVTTEAITQQQGAPSVDNSLDNNEVEQSFCQHQDSIVPPLDTDAKVLRSISRCSAEIEVSFQSEAEPGEGEIQLPEDEGVKKLLTNTSQTQAEVEVFESFTASDEQANQALESSPIAVPQRHPSGDPGPIAPPSPIHIGLPSSGSYKETTPSFIDTGIITPPIGQEGISTPDNLIHTFNDASGVFSGGLNMSDTDRMHDAWIPSETTRQVLVSVATSTPGTYFVDKEQLTMPVVCMDEPMGDPVKDLVYRFMGEQEAVKRSVLTADTVTPDEAGLKRLISAECYRAAIDLTSRLLALHGQGVGQGHTPVQHSSASLQIWFVRIALLAKVRQYGLAESECAAFGNFDRPDLYYEFYPELYPGRKGSMVPFCMRLIHAELPSHLAKATESLDRLYYLHAVVTKVIGNLSSGFAEDGSLIELSAESRQLSRELWEKREIQVLYSVVNCLLFLKDYHLAVEVLHQLIIKDKPNAAALWSAMGRVYLQIGDVSTSTTCFASSDKLVDSARTEDKCNSLINKGFLSMGLDNFEEARQNFKDAVDLDPENAVAINNMAVCSLYMGRLNEALMSLETLVHRNPQKYLQEGVLFNLSTLYELESSRAMHKKQTLLDLVSKYKGDNFNVACLKMA